MNKFAAFLVVVGAILALGLVGRMDLEEAAAEEALYCDMVARWKAEEAAGVPPNDRAGWPPFRGECDGHKQSRDDQDRR